MLRRFVTTHTLKQERVCSTVTARNLGQIGLKRVGATEAYDQYAAGSDNEADTRDGLKCEQLRRFHIVGNWKMNQSLQKIADFFSTLQSMETEKLNCEAWIAPQAMHLTSVLEQAKDLGKNWNLQVGGQNIAPQDSGAFTGENSPAALKDLGASFTLVGHSERRTLYLESGEELREKMIKALQHDLKAIFCVGETLAERESGQTIQVVAKQLQEGLTSLPREKLNNVIVAYEPVWAIGTGKVASPQDAQQVHQDIRKQLSALAIAADKTVILYGGSVKPENIEDLLSCPDIDGALVGGASLSAESFAQLCHKAHSCSGALSK